MLAVVAAPATAPALTLRPLLVWSVPARFSASGRYWFWKCRLCDYMTKDLIPALNLAYNDAIGHLCIHQGDDD